jgi:hypothetical protein
MKCLQKTALWFVLMILSGGIVSAQQCVTSNGCACNQKDLSPAGVTVGMRHLKGMWMFSYNYMNMQMQGNQSGTSPVSNNAIYNNYLMAGTKMNMDMHMLMGMYGITDRLTVMAMASYDVMNMSMVGLPGETMTMYPDGSMTITPSTTSQAMQSKSSGWSDTKLLAQYAFYIHKGTSLTASAGVSIPTGSTQEMGTAEDMYLNRRLPYMMQLGSGTVDLLPGLTYLHSDNHNFEFSVQATSAIRTYNNNVGYRLGNEFNLNAWAAYQLFGCLSPSVRVEGTNTGNIQGYDPELQERIIEPSGSSANYGGNVVNGYVGLSYYFKKVPVLNTSRVLVEYGIPLYQNLNGIQLSTKSTFNATWRLAF